MVCTRPKAVALLPVLLALTLVQPRYPSPSGFLFPRLDIFRAGCRAYSGANGEPVTLKLHKVAQCRPIDRMSTLQPASGSRRGRRPRSDRDDASQRAAKRVAAIDRAFDAAANGDASTIEKSRRSGRRAIVPDDENEDDEDEMMLEAVDIAPTGQQDPGLGGGFLPDESTYDPAGGGEGGGFLPEPGSGAPFSADTTSGGGGFLLPEDTNMDGGFLPEPSDAVTSEGTFQGGGGGFLVDEAGGGEVEHLAGGFLPEGNAEPDYTNDGGFLALPDVPQQFLGAEPSASDLLPLPDPNAPPPRDRIALTAIPAALRSLGLHQIGLQGAEVMVLFEEVASDDDEAEGGKSVHRERFKEACQVLLGSDDDDEDDDSDLGDRAEYREAEDGQEDDFIGPGRRRLRRGGAEAATAARGALKDEEPTRVQPTRKSTRGKAAGAGEQPAAAADEAPTLDALPPDFEEDDESSFGSNSDAEEQSVGKGKKGGTKAQTKKGKRGRRVAVDPSQPLSHEDLAAASDTFDLFFEESPQLPFAQKDRHISLLELQRACRVLKEKMSDGDVRPVALPRPSLAATLADLS